MQVVVIEARVRSSADVPVRAVIREDQSVMLHGMSNDKSLWAKAREVGSHFQTNTQAHGKRVARIARIMPRWIDMGIERIMHGKAQRVIDQPGLHLIITNQSGKNG